MQKPQKEEEKLNREIDKIQNILMKDELNEEKYEKYLNRIVTTNNYTKVEKAYKSYLKDYLTIHNSIIDFYNSLNIENLITIQNIEKDGKDFIKTKKDLINFQNQLNKLSTEYEKLVTKNDLDKYIDRNINKYYINYFKELIKTTPDPINEKDLKSYINESNELLTNSISLFEYLSNNKENWEIKEEKLTFKSQEILDEYQNILKKITN